ncbi:hypothetical protein RRG08_061486 [Elysia crispata]|uniref:RING-type domain-containing protein n=1 Tax=Elysia crispata TaxID=231223 RepID=A0AAE1CX59_9GAST|nr:hypothetical protein RRG08_061486 [Elysia crispata]
MPRRRYDARLLMDSLSTRHVIVVKSLSMNLSSVACTILTMDCCRCFHCGGGLRNWLKTDNVFVEHVKCFPKCIFIHSVVGTDFANATQGIRMNKLHGGNMNCTITLEEVLDKLKVMDLTKMKNIQTASRRRFQILNSGDKKQEEEEEEHSKDCYDNPVRFADCKVCFTRRATVAFFPCGHLACCEDCGRIKNCPICRGEVMQSVNDVSIPLITKDDKSTTNGMCVMCMAQLEKTETQFDYRSGSPMVDYLCEMYGRAVGVSVTRVMKYNGPYTWEDAERGEGKFFR